MQFSFKIPQDEEDYILKRAERLAGDGILTATAYVRMMISQWFASGCPPLSQADAGAPPPPAELVGRYKKIVLPVKGGRDEDMGSSGMGSEQNPNSGRTYSAQKTKLTS